MAHYRRRYPRARARGDRSRHNWSWPRWHDLIFHTRPRRRAEHAELVRVLHDEVDADEALFPLGNHKPHKYYW